MNVTNKLIDSSATNLAVMLSANGLAMPRTNTILPLGQPLSQMVRFHSAYSKKNQKTSIKNKKNSKAKVIGKVVSKTPTSGYIGNTRFDLMPKIFEKLLPTFLEGGHNLQTLLDKTIEAHDFIIYNHGVVEGTSKWKAITLYATELLEGKADVKNPGWVSTGSFNKWPKRLSHLLPLYIFVKDNVFNKELEKEIAEARRLFITLFKLNKVCIANSEINSHLMAIKGRHKLDPELISDFERFSREKLSVVRESITLSDISFDLFLGSSNGPNSRPKLNSALEEATVLRRDVKLYAAFKELCVITNNTHFLEFFEQCSKVHWGMELKGLIIRKLTTFPENANKSRAIAISDFWTQSVLAPVEQKVIEITKELYSKHCSYWSHSEGWDEILSWPPEIQDTLVSLDATAWTDNFPAALQLIVVKALFGQKLADAWKHLVVTCPWHVPHMPLPLFYGKGQGMGTKGSFAIAQLTDLIFVEFVYSKQYPNMTSPNFMKVGDDLILQDQDMKFKSWYEKIGVPINLSKSKFKTDFGNFNEYVSRNSWNGIDYSIISPGLVSKFLRNDYYCVVLYEHMKERQHPSSTFTEILEMKKGLDTSKANFDLEKYSTRQRKLLKIVNFLDIISENPILGSTFSWDASKEEILLLLENLILAFLGEMCLATDNLEQDLNPENTALARDLWGELIFTDKDEFLDCNTKNFYKTCLSNKLTFREVVILRQAMPILRSKEIAYTQGLYESHIDQTIDLPLICDSCGNFFANPTFIDFILRCVDQTNDASLGYKTLKKGPLFSKSKVSNTLNLYSFLNNIIDLESRILDMETSILLLPKAKENKERQLNPMYTGGYSRMFGLTDMLSQIERIRSEEKCKVTLFPTTTANRADEV